MKACQHLSHITVSVSRIPSAVPSISNTNSREELKILEGGTQDEVLTDP